MVMTSSEKTNIQPGDCIPTPWASWAGSRGPCWRSLLYSRLGIPSLLPLRIKLNGLFAKQKVRVEPGGGIGAVLFDIRQVGLAEPGAPELQPNPDAAAQAEGVSSPLRANLLNNNLFYYAGVRKD